MVYLGQGQKAQENTGSPRQSPPHGASLALHWLKYVPSHFCMPVSDNTTAVANSHRFPSAYYILRARLTASLLGSSLTLQRSYLDIMATIEPTKKLGLRELR